jgi:hypothetical protein
VSKGTGKSCSFALKGAAAGASSRVACYIASSSESSESSPAPRHTVGSLLSSPRDEQRGTASPTIQASKTPTPSAPSAGGEA